MIKYLLSGLLFALSCTANAWTQTPSSDPATCSKEAPYGFPTGKDGVGICRTGYMTVNDPIAKLPVWTAWTLTEAEAVGCIDLSSSPFVDDKSLPAANRAYPQDYTYSDFDRGHIAPDADMSYGSNALYESYLMTNIAPQYPGLNRGIWKSLETYTRGWVLQQKTSITVYAGPIYNSKNPPKIGNGVTVPSAYYKILIDNNSKTVLAFIFPNSNQLGTDLEFYRTTVTNIENKTNLKFPLPALPILNKKTTDFVLDYNALMSAKQTSCN